MYRLRRAENFSVRSKLSGPNITPDFVLVSCIVPTPLICDASDHMHSFPHGYDSIGPGSTNSYPVLLPSYKE